MNWDHRFVKVTTESGAEVGLYEVYYENDVPIARTKDPATIVGDTLELAIAELAHAATAAGKPVLTDDEIGVISGSWDDVWRKTYPTKPEWWDDVTEPRCDICGVHTEEALDHLKDAANNDQYRYPGGWCGECGNCADHCECGT